MQGDEKEDKKEESFGGFKERVKSLIINLKAHYSAKKTSLGKARVDFLQKGLDSLESVKTKDEIKKILLDLLEKNIHAVQTNAFFKKTDFADIHEGVLKIAPELASELLHKTFTDDDNYFLSLDLDLITGSLSKSTKQDVMRRFENDAEQVVAGAKKLTKDNKDFRLVYAVIEVPANSVKLRQNKGWNEVTNGQLWTNSNQKKIYTSFNDAKKAVAEYVDHPELRSYDEEDNKGRRPLIIGVAKEFKTLLGLKKLQDINLQDPYTHSIPKENIYSVHTPDRSSKKSGNFREYEFIQTRDASYINSSYKEPTAPNLFRRSDQKEIQGTELTPQKSITEKENTGAPKKSGP